MRSPRVFQAPAPGVSVGANVVHMDATPLAPMKSRANFWYIEPFSANCERLAVDTFTGQDLNLSQPTELAHPTNSFIMAVHSGVIGPWLYGAYQSVTPDRQFADDWRPTQRMLIEHKGVICRVGNYSLYAAVCTGQPIMLQDGNYLRDGHIYYRYGEDWNPALMQFNIPNDHPIGQAGLMKTAGGISKFTADASTNEITLISSPNPDLVVGNTIILDDPYNKGFPGGVLQGYTYLIKTWNSVTRKLTLARTDTPGTTVDITSNGATAAGATYAGIAWFNFLVPVDVRLDKINSEGESAPGGAIAALLCLNEKGTTKDMRVQGSSVSIGGKLSKHWNQTLQASGVDQPALWFWGEHEWSSYFNSNDASGQGMGMKYSGKHLHVKSVHQEGSFPGIDVLAGGHGLRIDQHFRSRQSLPNHPAIRDLLGDNRSSWQIGRVVSGTGLVNVNYIQGADNDGQLITGDGNLNPLIPNLFYCDQRFVSPTTFKDDQGHVQIPNRFGIVVDLLTYPSFKFGIGYRAGVIVRGTGTVILPNPAKFTDWEAVFYRNVAGTTDFKDHLGNTLAAGVGAGLKRFRWVDKTPYATDNWIIT